MAKRIFFLSVIAGFAYLYMFGVHMGGDSDFYMQGSSSAVRSSYPLYYQAYPLLLGIIKTPLLVVCLQILLHGVSSVMMYVIGSKLFNRRAGLFAGTIYALLFEIMQWDTYILTDSLFLFFVILAALLHLYSKKVSIAVAIATLFLRPTALPLLGAVFVTHTWQYKKSTKIILYSIGTFIVLGIVFYGLSQDGENRLGLSGYMHYFASLFERGIIVRDRPEFIMPVQWQSGITAVNIFLFLSMVASKLVLFWAPVIQKFSPAHQVLNIITLIPIYVFAILGLSYANISKTLFLIMPILSFWIFHALTEVDYDWRYRLPALALLIIFAGYGASEVFRRVTLKAE